MGESRMEDILEATINGKKYTEPSGSRIETLLIELNELIIEGGGGGSSTAYATALSLTINSSTYVMTAQLLNKDGDPIGTAQTVDLPLESVVVGATYDNTTKSIILTLQSGSTTSVPVGDLVAGLVSTSDLETALSTKQDTISDLSTIRSNATAGAGAAEVVTGIDSTANNYLELKSGLREYLATTIPTGNVPTGSVGMGFDEGVYTYKSGTKVSDGELTANLFYRTGEQVGYYIDSSGGLAGGIYAMGWCASDYIKIKENTQYTFNPNSVTGTSAKHCFYNEQKQALTSYIIPSGQQTFTTPQGAVYARFSYKDASSNIMLNEGSTPLPYEPYGKRKISFYANGQSLADYTIYGTTGGVGDPTANLFDKSATVDTTTLNWAAIYTISGLDSSQSYTLSTNYVKPSGVQAASLYLATSTSVSTYTDGVWSGLSKTKQPNEDGTLLVIIRTDQGTTDAQPIYDDVLNGTVLVMLNTGSTTLPYESYGYKIPVICGGQTTNIYLDSPLGANDSIDYTTAQVTIPTVDGVNNLICDTSVQPSKVSLTYTGWHSDLDEIKSRLAAIEQAIAQGE